VDFIYIVGAVVVGIFAFFIAYLLLCFVVAILMDILFFVQKLGILLMDRTTGMDEFYGEEEEEEDAR
jgi:hypothetical protein